MLSFNNYELAEPLDENLTKVTTEELRKRGILTVDDLTGFRDDEDYEEWKTTLLRRGQNFISEEVELFINRL